jgi:hypothetical protein
MAVPFEQYANGLSPDKIAAKLHAACSAGDVDEVQRLLKAGDKSLVNAPDIDMYTPLHRAADKGHSSVAWVLLDAGADLNASHPGLDGWTPLHIACWRNASALVKMFCERGADPNALDWYGSTPAQLGNAETRAIVEGKGQGTTNTFTELQMTEKCEMVPSAKQMAMIEFSMAHCMENGIGGEFVEDTAPSA